MAARRVSALSVYHGSNLGGTLIGQLGLLTLEIELTSLVRGWYEQTALIDGGNGINQQ